MAGGFPQPVKTISCEASPQHPENRTCDERMPATKRNCTRQAKPQREALHGKPNQEPHLRHQSKLAPAPSTALLRANSNRAALLQGGQSTLMNEDLWRGGLVGGGGVGEGQWGTGGWGKGVWGGCPAHDRRILVASLRPHCQLSLLTELLLRLGIVAAEEVRSTSMTLISEYVQICRGIDNHDDYDDGCGGYISDSKMMVMPMIAMMMGYDASF